jgi:hypothetical protein
MFDSKIVAINDTKTVFERDFSRSFGFFTYGVLVLCVASLAVFELFSYRYRFHSDAATAGMLALEQMRTKSLFVHGWYYSQDFWPMFVVNFVTILHPVIKNAYLATEIQVLLQTLVLFVVSRRLIRSPGGSALQDMVLAFLFSGVSALWADTFFGQGQYGNVLLWIVCGCSLIVTIQTDPRRNRKYAALLGLLLLTSGINATSIRYLILFSGAATGALIWCALFEKRLADCKYLFAAIGVILIGTVLGQMAFQSLKAQYDFRDGVNGAWIIGYEKALSVNVAKLLHGFGTLLSDNQREAPVTSVAGAFNLCQLTAAAGFLGFFLSSARRVILSGPGQTDFRQRFIASVFSLLLFVSVFILIFTNAAYDNVGAARYLAAATFMGFLLAAIHVAHLRIPMKFQLALAGFLLPLILYNGFSLNADLLDGRRPERDNLAKFLAANGLKSGYATFWQADVLTVQSNYRVHVFHIADDKLDPWLFMSTKRFYCDPAEEGNFILLTEQEVGKFDFSSVPAELRSSLVEYRYHQFHIFKYGGPLLKDYCQANA